MANRQRAEARRKAAAKAARQSGEGGSKAWLWASLVVVAVVVAVVLVFTLGGNDKGSSSASTDSTAVTSDLPDSQPVTVTGDALDPFDGSASTDPAVGKVAPTLSGLNFQGEPIVIDPAKNGPYMLVFLAHWCPHCNAEVPRLLTWKKSGAVPTGLNVIGIATAVSKTSPNYPPGNWFSNKGWSWPVMVDESQGDAAAGKAAQAMGATGWPYFIIIGADGKVKVRVSGEVQINELTQIVDKALAS